MSLRQLDQVAGVVITATYLLVFVLLLIGLLRTRQVLRNRLGLATAMVFFAAAAYRGASAVLVARGQSISDADNLYLTAALDLLIALVGIFYLSLRRQFGTLITANEEDIDAGATPGKGRGTDELTGLPIEKKALEVLRRQLSATSLSGEKLAVLIIHIDQIEEMLEREGGMSGDTLLGHVGALLRDQLRHRDFAARMGPSEFMIAMPGANRETAIRVSQRLDARIQRLIVSGLSGVPAAISTGIGISPDDARDAQGMVKAAREAAEYARRLGGGHFLFSRDVERALDLDSDVLDRAPSPSAALSAKAMLDNMRKHDPNTAAHMERVARYAIALAERTGFPPEDLPLLRIAALLHDIGMISLSQEILAKPGKLTAEEYLMVREHPQIGYQMVKSVTGLQAAAIYILYHHESYSGHGYPEGLEGPEIPLGARILCVAESFDNMHVEMPYRQALSLAEVKRRLTSASGNQFDPDIVKVMNALAGTTFVDDVEALAWSEAEMLLDDSPAPRAIIGRLKRLSGRRLAAGNPDQ
ncbi:MAG TPA: diguanylate cyclase [Candidatus Dormibacteraeota bacterium]|nr:diguanylate cyclase [Candidatus Dormibacteraeota bacterium]